MLPEQINDNVTLKTTIFNTTEPMQKTPLCPYCKGQTILVFYERKDKPDWSYFQGASF